MPGTFPPGLATKTITFGRYGNALGSNRGGTVRIGFDEPMLHVPSGQVITAGMEPVTIDFDTGATSVVVPITVTPDLVAKWKSNAPYSNQRLKIDVAVDGYESGLHLMDVTADDPAIMDFDFLSLYTTPNALPVLRASVSSVAGLTGDVTAQALAAALGVGANVRFTPMTAANRVAMSDAWSDPQRAAAAGTAVLDATTGVLAIWNGIAWRNALGAVI